MHRGILRLATKAKVDGVKSRQRAVCDCAGIPPRFVYLVLSYQSDL